MTISLETQFSSAHYYHQKKWLVRKNKEVFGKCFSKYGHGHDYRLVVYYKFPITSDNQNSPAITNFLRKQQASLDHLSERLDHCHLNFDLTYFKNVVPTTENICLYCLDFLIDQDPDVQILKLRLHERPDLWVEHFSRVCT